MGATCSSPTSDPSTSPEFSRHVLERLPTAVVVIARDGTVVYGNPAASELAGASWETVIGSRFPDLIHPDDVAWAVSAFTDIRDDAHRSEVRNSWAPVRFRIQDHRGGYATIEVTGANAVGDPDVGGLIFSLRSCRDDELLDEIFTAVAASQPIDATVPPIIQRLMLPPLRFEAAVYELDASGVVRCVDTSHPVLRDLPFRREDAVPWGGLDTGPTRVELSALPTTLAEALDEAGFGAVFYAAAHAPDLSTSLVVVAATRGSHDAANGPIDRLRRAQASLSTVLLKAHHDLSIRNDAHRDDLTGLPNRVAFHRLLDQLARRTDDAAMLFIDIDGFKSVNDQHGHQFGDEVLSVIAGRLGQAMRPHDFVCRLGGDEFAVIISDGHGRLTDVTVSAVADRVAQTFAEPIDVDGQTVLVGASVGVARLDARRDVDLLIGRADGAMYIAKRGGGGRHHVDPSSAA